MTKSNSDNDNRLIAKAIDHIRFIGFLAGIGILYLVGIILVFTIIAGTIVALVNFAKWGLQEHPQYSLIWYALMALAALIGILVFADAAGDTDYDQGGEKKDSRERNWSKTTLWYFFYK